MLIWPPSVEFLDQNDSGVSQFNNQGWLSEPLSLISFNKLVAIAMSLHSHKIADGQHACCSRLDNQVRWRSILFRVRVALLTFGAHRPNESAGRQSRLENVLNRIAAGDLIT